MADSRFGSGRLLVVAFEGWNDAGEAASGAVRMLREQLDLDQLAEVDPEDYFDYQFNRPLISLDDEGNRSLSWPTVALFGPKRPLEVPVDLAGDAHLGVTGDNGSNIYLLVGNEPGRSWKTFAAEILEAIVQAISSVAFVVPGALGVWPAVAVVPPDSSGGHGASTNLTYFASV